MFLIVNGWMKNVEMMFGPGAYFDSDFDLLSKN